MAKKPKLPKDTNQRAKKIVDIATGEIEDENPDAGKDKAAVELGRKGGLKGGKARARELKPEYRTEIAKKAAKKRWSSKKK